MFFKSLFVDGVQKAPPLAELRRCWSPPGRLRRLLRGLGGARQVLRFYIVPASMFANMSQVCRKQRIIYIYIYIYNYISILYIYFILYIIILCIYIYIQQVHICLQSNIQQDKTRRINESWCATLRRHGRKVTEFTKIQNLNYTNYIQNKIEFRFLII